MKTLEWKSNMDLTGSNYVSWSPLVKYILVFLELKS